MIVMQDPREPRQLTFFLSYQILDEIIGAPKTCSFQSIVLPQDNVLKFCNFNDMDIRVSRNYH